MISTPLTSCFPPSIMSWSARVYQFNLNLPSSILFACIKGKAQWCDQNIRGTSTSVVGVNIKCSQTVPCERVSLSNINLNGEKEHSREISSVCTNAKSNYAGFHHLADSWKSLSSCLR
jgi:hypothetical protein